VAEESVRTTTVGADGSLPRLSAADESTKITSLIPKLADQPMESVAPDGKGFERY